MAGVNKVILVGNLGADPEIRNLPSGSAVANFNIATSESYTNKNGEKVTNTEWHRIECWEGLAKVAQNYLKKGNPVYIEGKIRTEEWTDKEGQKRYTTKIRAQSMTMLGGAPGNGNQQPAPQEQGQQAGSWMPKETAPQPGAGEGFGSDGPKDDDLPF
jgi:single-strand DNA-binding protein